MLGNYGQHNEAYYCVHAAAGLGPLGEHNGQLTNHTGIHFGQIFVEISDESKQ